VKILPHLLQICDVGCECDVIGLHTTSGSATPPLVVVDEMERIERRSSSGRRKLWSKSGPPWRTMIAVPCLPSRAYNSAPATGMRFPRGVALHSFSTQIFEAGGNRVPYAHAMTARTSVLSWR
jgi:hypothetical protein